MVFLTKLRGGTTLKIADLSFGMVCLQSISHRKTADAKFVQHTIWALQSDRLGQRSLDTLLPSGKTPQRRKLYGLAGIGQSLGRYELLEVPTMSPESKFQRNHDEPFH